MANLEASECSSSLSLGGGSSTPDGPHTTNDIRLASAGTLSRASSAPAAAASCAPSSAKGAARASPTPRLRGSRCCPTAAETASWKQEKSAIAVLTRSDHLLRPWGSRLTHAPSLSLLHHHVFCSLFSDFRSAQSPAALPTIAPCVRGCNAPTVIAVRGAW